jgi:hypothetical protein
MERSIEILLAIQMIVVGISHARRPHVWIDLFVRLRAAGRAGVLGLGMFTLWVGSLVVAFHPSWSGPFAIVTLFGWIQCFKGALYLLQPEVALRLLEGVTHDRPRRFVAAGSLLTIFGLVILLGPAIASTL